MFSFRTLIITLFIFLVSYSNAQNKNTNMHSVDMFDAISKSLKTKPKVFISSDTKNSFISSRAGLFFGAKLGLEFDNTFRIGLGFSGLFNKTYSGYINGIKKSEENLNFNYVSLFAEYIYNNQKKYDFALPVALGFGYSWLGDFETSPSRDFVILYETQLIGTYYPISYLGIGAGVGYRIMLLNNSYIDEKFTAPIYSIKLKINFGEIIELI